MRKPADVMREVFECDGWTVRRLRGRPFSEIDSDLLEPDKSNETTDGDNEMTFEDLCRGDVFSYAQRSCRHMKIQMQPTGQNIVTLDGPNRGTLLKMTSATRVFLEPNAFVDDSPS